MAYGGDGSPAIWSASVFTWTQDVFCAVSEACGRAELRAGLPWRLARRGYDGLFASVGSGVVAEDRLMFS
ncbi:hypothetical protein Cob_v011678 [Colletotrichum orbiculare MAFF 240422]|uniref:Uncharacterized protein n=1 Tax=Colletotrichum orbiculare (strain 104-T / ATCC 96160 / CBS 514.97 / LARS 414 / MAFF 240422) TaxID=1213857 RepID=A0A484FB14_COLOR|nr:hypothetical protein Cob_v011678 [Colletotrichum orbiculare MAFF 240422]